MEKWEREPLTDEEITAIFDECSTVEERLIVAFLADTGCRVNELLRVREIWVNWSAGKYGALIVPVQATSGKRPKTKKEKTIPITRRLRDVFTTAKNTPGGIRVDRTPQHIYNVVNRLGEAVGLYTVGKAKGRKTVYTVCAGVDHSKGWHVTPHIFRHSFITRCYYKGKLDKEEIGALAGHRDGEMVGTVYLHIDSEKTRSKLEDAGFLD